MLFRSITPAASSAMQIPNEWQSLMVLFLTTGVDPKDTITPEPPDGPHPALTTVLPSMCPLPFLQILMPSCAESITLFRVTLGSASVSTSTPDPALALMMLESSRPRPSKQTAMPSPPESRTVLFRTTGFARFMMYSPTDWLAKMSLSSMMPIPSSTHVTPHDAEWWIEFDRIVGSAPSAMYTLGCALEWMSLFSISPRARDSTEIPHEFPSWMLLSLITGSAPPSSDIPTWPLWETSQCSTRMRAPAKILMPSPLPCRTCVRRMMVSMLLSIPIPGNAFSNTWHPSISAPPFSYRKNPFCPQRFTAQR
mmetsp:Transcript_50309/g.119650  ORF Transcript_50309/g.119650 Transcript_50309/m.119650 type:complete len:309 (-) Transcript_50309:1495-2421(-)